MTSTVATPADPKERSRWPLAVYLAAAKLGCHADTIYARAKECPALAAAMRHERGVVVDTAEQKLFDAITAGEPWAIQLALKTLGKDRGYVEKTEVEQTATVQQVTEVVVRSREEAAALLPKSET